MVMAKKQFNKRASDHVAEPKKLIGFWGRLRGYLIAGVLVTTPITATLYMTWALINFVDGWVTGLLPAAYQPQQFLPFAVPGLGLIALVVFLVLVGALAANFFGRFFIRISEAVLARMPFVRSIYGAIKQIMETVLASQSQAFREVVLVEYPRREMWVIGFRTGTTQGEVQGHMSDEMVNVFIPTTPNPTSGFLIFVPKRDVTPLEMSVEEGIKMVVSAGIVTPDYKGPERRKKRKS